MNVRDMVVLFWGMLVGGAMLLAPLPWGNAVAQEDANVNFRWAFEALLMTENPPRHLAITQDTPLKTGDHVKMFVELLKPCFVYVVHHGTQGELHWLFPYGQAQRDEDIQTEQRYDIPPGDMWYKLDESTGQETFYLLASAHRLGELEALLSSYALATPEEQPRLAAGILTEIREVRRRHLKSSTLAERPVPIAGNRRGEIPAVEITAHNLYSKTVTIEHR